MTAPIHLGVTPLLYYSDVLMNSSISTNTIFIHLSDKISLSHEPWGQGLTFLKYNGKIWDWNFVSHFELAWNSILITVLKLTVNS